MADNQIKFKFKNFLREQVANQSTPMSWQEQQEYTGKDSNYSKNSAYRNLQADIRYTPGSYNSAGFVSPDYPQTAFILGKDMPDTLPHEIAHTQQNLDRENPRLNFWNNLSKYNKYKTELKDKGQFDSEDEYDNFINNGQSPRELTAYLQGLEGSSPAGTNILIQKFKGIDPNIRRNLETDMFPHLPKIFQGKKGDIPEKKPDIIKFLQRQIRNWTAK